MSHFGDHAFKEHTLAIAETLAGRIGLSPLDFSIAIRKATLALAGGQMAYSGGRVPDDSAWRACGDWSNSPRRIGIGEDKFCGYQCLLMLYLSNSLHSVKLRRTSRSLLPRLIRHWADWAEILKTRKQHTKRIEQHFTNHFGPVCFLLYDLKSGNMFFLGHNRMPQRYFGEQPAARSGCCYSLKKRRRCRVLQWLPSRRSDWTHDSTQDYGYGGDCVGKVGLSLTWAGWISPTFATLDSGGGAVGLFYTIG